MLTVKNFSLFLEQKQILKNINLKIKKGEIHAIMGPNGAGKTSLAMGIMGQSNFKYPISNVKFQINGKNMLDKSTEERAKNGIFVSFQNPVEISGVTYFSFLRASHNLLFKNKLPILEFKKEVISFLEKVGLKEDFLYRYLNEGFSGGEKKRSEVVQLLLLKPKFAILDEIDSGLDLDGLKKISQVLKKYILPNTGLIIISHQKKIFEYLRPDYVHILKNGKIKKSGGFELLKIIEEKGYEEI